jgi:hypothetical protein
LEVSLLRVGIEIRPGDVPAGISSLKLQRKSSNAAGFADPFPDGRLVGIPGSDPIPKVDFT